MPGICGSGLGSAVLILAGGEGWRIGGGKPLRLLGGRTLLQRAIDQATRWSDHVVISARVDQAGGADAPVLPDRPDVEGPLAGLFTAARMGAPWVLTIPCDMPFLPVDLPEKLAKAVAGRSAALASSGGRVHPVCGLWRADALDQLSAYAATGRRSLIGFAEWIGFTAVEWDGDPFFNVNGLEELAAAEARLG